MEKQICISWQYIPCGNAVTFLTEQEWNFVTTFPIRIQHHCWSRKLSVSAVGANVCSVHTLIFCVFIDSSTKSIAHAASSILSSSAVLLFFAERVTRGINLDKEPTIVLSGIILLNASFYFFCGYFLLQFVHDMKWYNLLGQCWYI